jgi:hypothetical protein
VGKLSEPIAGRKSQNVAGLAAPMVPVITGQRCAGFMLSAGPRGVRAFDADGRELGTYMDPAKAAAAIEAATGAGCRACGVDAT